VIYLGAHLFAAIVAGCTKIVAVAGAFVGIS
jgi:hypothetical protein